MLPPLCDYLLTHWAGLPLEGPQPHDLAVLVRSTGVSKLCCYIFPDGESMPRWVAKIARTPQDNGALAREVDLIRHLRRAGSDFVRMTIPAPLLTASIAGHLVEVEPYFSGHLMTALPNNTSGRGDQLKLDCLEHVMRWLSRSQQDTCVQHRRLTEEEVGAYLLSPIAQFKVTARMTDAETAYLDDLRKQLVTLAENPLPLVFSHGDLWPGNILVQDDRILVIDWEFGEAAALPLMDVFSLLARTYAWCHDLEEIDGYLEDYVAAFEAVFLEDGDWAGIAEEYVTRACLALDVDPAWLEALFALFLVTEAIKYHAFLHRRASRGYIYLLRSRKRHLGDSYRDQLARQKNVWLLGHLAQHRDRLAFRHLGPSSHPSSRPYSEEQQ